MISGSDQPHTSRDSSTIIRNFAHCSSSARMLPSSVEAKPHCGDSAELLERRELRRLVDAALDVVLLLQRADLGGDEAEHHDLVALRQEPQRLEAAGAVGVVFQEIAVEVHAAEQPLGDRLVAARGHPGGFEVAAADMRGDGHVGGLRRQRGVDHVLVDLRQVVRHRHAVARRRHLGRRAQIRPHGVVELQVAAAGVVERLHRLGVGLAEIGEDSRRGRDRRTSGCRPWAGGNASPAAPGCTSSASPGRAPSGT